MYDHQCITPRNVSETCLTCHLGTIIMAPSRCTVQRLLNSYRRSSEGLIHCRSSFVIVIDTKYVYNICYALDNSAFDCDFYITNKYVFLLLFIYCITY